MSYEISARQIAWFRMRRSGLVEPFARPEDAAARLLGVQAQMPAAAAIALWNRVADCRRVDLDRARLERRSLVRMWGQRNTVHLYRATDWPLLYRLFEARSSLLERRLAKAGLAPDFRRLVRRIERRLAAGRELVYDDVRSRKLTPLGEPWVIAYTTFMALVRRGVACHGPDRGNRSTFVHRDHWMPGLAWDPPSAEEAGGTAARRYLAAYGPASSADLAFWAGATNAQARRWLASADGVARVAHGGDELWARSVDLAELTAATPVRSRWPLRLLHRFDPLLLATRDKDWLIDPRHYKKVWRPAAHVEAVVLAGGRITGTWRYDRAASGLRVAATMFGEPSRAQRKRIEAEATRLGRFLESDLREVRIEGTAASATTP